MDSITTLYADKGSYDPPVRLIAIACAYAETEFKINSDGSMYINLAPLDGLIVPSSQVGRYACLSKRLIHHDRVAMGVGQVMGFHWRKLGYSSSFHMFKALEYDLSAQVASQLIIVSEMVRTLRDRHPSASTMAGIYTGSKQDSRWIGQYKSALHHFRNTF